MHRLTSRPFATGAVAAILLAAAQGTRCEDALVAEVGPTGVVQVRRGATALATFELNAHGPGWNHASQKDATATIADFPEGNGKKVVGALPIPETEGGAIQYTQTITPLAQGFRLEFDLTMSRTMKLNGLQFSINLPVESFAGKEVLVTPASGQARLVGLPKEQPAAGRFQLWSGQGAKVDVAARTPDALTIELRAATDVVVQDLRQWEQPVFEIRFPAFTEDAGREMSKGRKFHLDLMLTAAGPLQLKVASK